MVYLTRVEHFNAAHKLYNPSWSKEQNELAFGKCANENWHGHNYELYITIKGDPDPGTGFLFDVKKLSELIKDKVIEKLDHKNLNMDVEFMQGKMCSTENLAIGHLAGITGRAACCGQAACHQIIRNTENLCGIFWIDKISHS